MGRYHTLTARRRAGVFSAGACIALAAWACGNSTEAPRVASLSVTPNPIALDRGDSVQLAVSALDGSGHLVTGVSVAFASNNTSLVTVSALGLVRSVGSAGSTNIQVTGGGVLQLVPVTVTQVPVGLALAPADTTIPQGASFQYRAHVVDAFGDSIPGKTITYAWSDSAELSVSPTGRASAIGAAGPVTVTAHSAPYSALATITVRDTTIVATLPLSGGPLGIAVAGDVAYVSRAAANRVDRLDLAALQFTASIAVGSTPCFLVFDAAATTAYVANQLSDNIGVIDVPTNTQVRAIPVNGDPLPVAISADGTTLLATTNADRLYKIGVATDAVTDSLSLPATSHHLLMHPNDSLLYVATRDAGSVLEVNWRTMSVVRTFTLGGRTQGMAISADRQELYVANESSNVLHVVTLATGASVAIPLAGGGEGLALSADGTKLYVGLVFAGKVQVIDRVARSVIQTVFTGGTPRELATDGARQRVLVANEGGWVDVLR